jgi:hypothetical protein
MSREFRELIGAPPSNLRAQLDEHRAAGHAEVRPLKIECDPATGDYYGLFRRPLVTCPRDIRCYLFGADLRVCLRRAGPVGRTNSRARLAIVRGNAW